MSFSEQMSAGRTALASGAYQDAYLAFARAHDEGHAVKRDHLAAHRGMIAAATKRRRLDLALKNVVLMSAAFLFDRDRSDARAA